jgi:starch synthase
VLHANDWPCGLAPAYLRFGAGAAASLTTVHNLAFQGLFPQEWVSRLGLPPESFAIDGLEFHGRMSFLKAGLVYADGISTVSPTYAREIQAPELGCGLDGLLRHRGAALSGILNGIDDEAWNPAADPHLAARYDADALAGKAANKAALQARFGLPVSAQTPLFGMVGRMTSQKGTDLVVAAAARLAELGQLVILGTGEREIEQAVSEAAGRHPDRIAARIGFDEGLAHLLEAGADIFLMPSRFEPCGLNQMYSQRYGTPPVVRATGGLADTVEEGVTGFAFQAPTAEALAEAALRAVQCYREPARWRAMQRAGMARDFSWSAAAPRYAALYRALAARPRR